MIAANNVTTAKIASNNVTTALIAANNVTTASIASGNITSALIDGGAITTAKIAANNITTATIAAGNIDTLQINTSAVSTVKVADNAITNTVFNEGSLTDITTEGSYNTICTASIAVAEHSTIIATATFIGSHFGGSGTDSDGNVIFDYRIRRKLDSGSFATKQGILNSQIGGLNSPGFILTDISSTSPGLGTYEYILQIELDSHNGYAHTLRILNPVLGLQVLKR